VLRIRSGVPVDRWRLRTVGAAGTAGTFAALALLGSPAHAASAQEHPAGHVIHACYQRHHGWLRRVSGPNDCRHDEVALSWDESGAPGARGPAGPTGPVGPAASSARVLTGAATFVDTTETVGFIGAAGAAGLAPTADAVGTPLPVAGHVTTLQVRVGQSASGVGVELVHNGVGTPLHCATGATGACSATVGTPIAFAVGDTIAVEVTHSDHARVKFLSPAL
jgi:hypothetical protein